MNEKQPSVFQLLLWCVLVIMVTVLGVNAFVDIAGPLYVYVNSSPPSNLFNIVVLWHLFL